MPPNARAPRERGLRPLPPIPKAIFGLAGPFSVVRAERLESPDGERCAGLCEWPARIIRLDAALALPSAWVTLRHEWVHAALDEQGVVLPAGPDYATSPTERVCNAIAIAMVAEMRARG